MGDYSDAKGAVDSALDAQQTLVQNTSWQRSDLGVFGWHPHMPSGSCGSFDIYGKNLDICPPLGKARELWAWCLYLLTGFTIFYMATAAPGKGGK
ncbi:MAG TPA: hypothetical protein VLC92_21500 [Rhodocyclaceae bacterium]|nr:hypothetical protein [Rhodocyclaceae bacterium]